MCISFSGIFYEWARVSPSTGTVFRCLYGLPVLALVAWAERRRYGPLPSGTVRVAALAGIFFAGDLTFWHHAIGAIGAGLGTVLGNLQVVIVALAAWVLQGERPARRTLGAIPIVLGGVVLISGVVGTGAFGANPSLGIGLGLLTAVCYSGYLLVIRRGGRDLRRTAGPVAVATASTAVVATIAGLLVGDLDLVPSWPAHGWLLLLGLTSQSAGYLFISVSLPRLPAAITSVILLAQPVATVILARVLLGETPSLAQLAGVLLVVGGIAVAIVPIGRFRASEATAPA